MTYADLENLADYCIGEGMDKKRLMNLAIKMSIFESAVFVNILSKKGIEISL